MGPGCGPRAYRREHGHDPSRSACHQLARQANLDTRTAKKPARSLTEMRAAWRASLTEAFGRGAVRQLMDAVSAVASPDAGAARPDRLDAAQIAERAVASVATQRSTWTVWNLRAEAERIARAECCLGSLTEHRETIAAVIAEAISPRLSIRVDAPSLLDEPAALCRGDGESVFTEHASGRYTSQAVLDAEQRLLAAASTPTTAGLAGPAVAAALDGYEAITGRRLDPGQRHLVTSFAARSTLLTAGLGPAGSGKTTVLRCPGRQCPDWRRARETALSPADPSYRRPQPDGPARDEIIRAIYFRSLAVAGRLRHRRLGRL